MCRCLEMCVEWILCVVESDIFQVVYSRMGSCECT